MPERDEYIGSQTVISTTIGQPFNFVDPDPAHIHIDDMAESLAKDARYTGKTPGKFYSVAEHSVLVSYAVPGEYALMGLLHDSAEAYTGDWTSPFKKYMDRFTDAHRIVDKGITLAIFKKFGVKPYSEEDILAPCVHEADEFVYLQERYQLCHNAAEEWWDYHGDPEPGYPKIRCHEWRIAKFVFIKRFNELFYGFTSR